jgi:hypothetical protein
MEWLFGAARFAPKGKNGSSIFGFRRHSSLNKDGSLIASDLSIMTI